MLASYVELTVSLHLQVSELFLKSSIVEKLLDEVNVP